MAKRQRSSRRSGGLGASDFAHASMAGQKIRDLETVLDNAEGRRGAKPITSCESLLTHLVAGLADWGEVAGHLRSVPRSEYPALHDHHEQFRKRLMRLRARVGQCFR